MALDQAVKNVNKSKAFTSGYRNKKKTKILTNYQTMAKQNQLPMEMITDITGTYFGTILKWVPLRSSQEN